ncbi:MAG: ABC transporter ATP-binding protein [Candidatus Cloacimonetes bacterium]|nr:ABC transporter ATP-binding protein [Candidatus Cloacimonadota bacterium]
MTVPILRAEGLAKSFLFQGSQVLVLDTVELSICPGEFVSIVGPSGCGKSTLLELLAGISKPERGSIRYRNVEITGNTGILGYMPQDDLLFPWLTALENVLLPVRIKGNPVKPALDKIKELLPQFGLQDHTAHHPWQLSGGLRQRVAFLRTYMTGAELFLLDEPFANLDALTRLQLQNWLSGITRKMNLTVILVTHDISEALRLSDRIDVMSAIPGRFIRRFDIANFRRENPHTPPEESHELRSAILDLLLPAASE